MCSPGVGTEQNRAQKKVTKNLVHPESPQNACDAWGGAERAFWGQKILSCAQKTPGGTLPHSWEESGSVPLPRSWEESGRKIPLGIFFAHPGTSLAPKTRPVRRPLGCYFICLVISILFIFIMESAPQGYARTFMESAKVETPSWHCVTSCKREKMCVGIHTSSSKFAAPT